MRNSILSAALVSAAILGGIAGGTIRDHQIRVAEEDAWGDVLVVQNGTLVANPSALTPADLANAQIISRDPKYIAFCGNKAIVGDDIGEVFDLTHCKKAMSLDKAREEAKAI